MTRTLRGLYLAFIYLLLYAPILFLAVYSFNASKYSMQWQGLTLDWYAKLRDNEQLIEAAINSLRLAAVSATAATLLGSLAAVALSRYRFFGRKALYGSLFVVMVSPDIVMGIALLVFFMALSAPLGFATLFFSHVTFCLPFVTVTVLARLKGFDPHIVEAALDVGAGEYQIFRRILLPLALPAIAAGWLLSFTLSMDDVIVSFFVTGPTYEILPIKIYSMVRLGVKPEVNALCAVMFVLTLSVVLLAQHCIKEKP